MIRKSTLLPTVYAGIVFILLAPPLYNNERVRLLMWGLMLLWLLVTISDQKRGIPIGAIGIVLLVFILFTRSYLETNQLLYGRLVHVYYYCFFAISFKLIEKSDYEKYLSSFYLIMIISPIFVIISIYQAFTNPFIFREMSGSGLADVSHYYAKGVLGYDYIYALVVAIPMLMGLISPKSRLDKKWKWLVGINLILDIIFIFMSNYGLAFFSLVFGIIVFAAKGSQKSKNRILISLVLISALIIVYVNRINILEFLSRLLRNTYYNVKIQALIESATEEASMGRFDIWKNAFISFLDRPLFGYGYANQTVNTHSEILYTLVYNGAIIGGMVICTLFLPFGHCEYKQGMLSKVNLAALLIFIIVSTLNPTGVSLGAMVMCILKFPSILLEDSKRCNNLCKEEDLR